MVFAVFLCLMRVSVFLRVCEGTGKASWINCGHLTFQDGGGFLGGPLRYPDVVVFWVQCDQAVLDERCNKRVDKMIQRGMVQELEQFHQVSFSLKGR